MSVTNLSLATKGTNRSIIHILPIRTKVTNLRIRDMLPLIKDICHVLIHLYSPISSTSTQSLQQQSRVCSQQWRLCPRKTSFRPWNRTTSDVSNLQKRDWQLPQESARRSDLDLVFLPLHLHWSLLLHPLLRRLLPWHRACLCGLPMRKGQNGGQMLLMITLPLF